MLTFLLVELKLQAPFVIRSNMAGAHGVDVPLARNAKGELIIPGSHMIGKLASAMRELIEIAGDEAGADFENDLRNVFASEAQGVGADEATGREARRAITASDFVATEAAGLDGTRVRVARDTVMATVAEGMLQVIEEPFAPGTEVTFKGELRLFGDHPEGDPLIRRLKRALQFMTQVGGLRSVGFGRVVKVDGRVAPGEGGVAFEPPEGTTRLGLRLSFRDPFCVAEARNTPNTYVSADVVPGGVLKGAIARQVLAAQGLSGFLDEQVDKLPEDFRPLAKGFDGLTILHARPVPRGTQGARLQGVRPDSLAAVEVAGQTKIVDLAGLKDPSRAVLVAGGVPKMMFDWKPAVHSLADGHFGPVVQVPRELRIRTQVDDTYRAAKASRLFGIEYVRPDTHEFLAEVVVKEGAVSQSILASLAAALRQGLAGVGRGGAFCDVTVTDVKDRLRGPGPMQDRVVLVLQTPALLRNPFKDGLDLKPAYGEALKEIGLPDGWELKAVFARERLAGGSFFLKRRSGGAYAPWLLTEPGATFVLDRVSGADTLPEAWFRTGLPVPATLFQAYGMGTDKQYRHCPYLPENGYGEVSCGARLADGRLSHEALSPEALGLPVEEIDVVDGVLA